MGPVCSSKYGQLIEKYDFEASDKDDTGLGQWVVMVFRGSEGIVNHMVCGYNPCVTPSKAKRSTYQQHRRYFIEKVKYVTCPRKRFHTDLVQ